MNPNHRSTHTSLHVSRAAPLTLVALGCVLSLHASAQFVKIVDTGTKVPGGSFQEYVEGNFPAGTDRFSGFANAAISSNRVVFLGSTAFLSGQLASTGIFSAPAGGGALKELVTARTWLPEYTGPKSGPTAPNLSGGGVFWDFNTGLMDFKDGRLVFVASTHPEPGKYEHNSGVYSIRADGTALSRVLREKDPRPGSVSGTHEPIQGALAAQDRALVYVGQPNALYMQRGGVFDAFVDGGTPIPGSSANFSLTATGPVAYAGGAAFVTFQPGGLGIWRRNDDDADFVLLRQSQISGGDGPFPIYTFNHLSADSPDALTFVGGSLGHAQLGIFTQRTSTAYLSRDLTTVATTTTPVPVGGSGTFKQFDRIATHSRRVQVGATGPIYLETDVVFAARDASNQLALYAYTDDQVSSFGSSGGLQRVIGPGDSLDGKTVLHAGIGRNALSDSRMAFQVRFTDETEAIYTVPLRGLLPRSGVKVDTQVTKSPDTIIESSSDTVIESSSDSGETSAHAVSAAEDSGRRAFASGDGKASPLTGGVSVGAYAYSEDVFLKPHAQVEAIQRFIVLGDTVGQVVDVDFNFSFSGLLGVRPTPGSSAHVGVLAKVHQAGQPDIDLFKGELRLSASEPVLRLHAYSEPSALGDVLNAIDPFGDGRDAIGASVLTVREFNGLVKAHVGEILAVSYLLTASSVGEAIADFSHTLEAIASTSTPGASLAMLHTLPAPIPEPGQYLLMLSGIALVLARARRKRGRSRATAAR